MPLEYLTSLLRMVIILAVVATIVGWRYSTGPVIWFRRACGKSIAKSETAIRQELVDRVRQLLPQANDGNVIFSLQVESKTSGGSRVRVTTNTYYYKVFVADGDSLWIIPFAYDKKNRSYQLGQPVALTADLIKSVSLAGKRGKKLTVTFRLKPEVGLDSLVMVLEPLQFKRNKFYPFDFLQEEACDKGMVITEKLARSACQMTPEDLEKTRLEDECGNYAVAAGLLGFVGIIVASVSGSLPFTLLMFAAALVMFGVMMAKKQMPKISVVVVVIEAVIAYFLMKL